MLTISKITTQESMSSFADLAKNLHPVMSSLAKGQRVEVLDAAGLAIVQVSRGRDTFRISRPGGRRDVLGVNTASAAALSEVLRYVIPVNLAETLAALEAKK